jgi:hypothetical protein
MGRMRFGPASTQLESHTRSRLPIQLYTIYRTIHGPKEAR